MNSKQTSLAAAMLALTAAAFGAEIPKFGAGEMEKPERTFYVSTKGNDKNDCKNNHKSRRLWRRKQFANGIHYKYRNKVSP